MNTKHSCRTETTETIQSMLEQH